MSANVHPTYQDKSEAMMRAAQKAILKPVKADDTGAQPSKTGPAKLLQKQLQAEFSDSEAGDAEPGNRALNSADHNLVRQAVLIAIIAGATWVLGFSLYAHL